MGLSELPSVLIFPSTTAEIPENNEWFHFLRTTSGGEVEIRERIEKSPGAPELRGRAAIFYCERAEFPEPERVRESGTTNHSIFVT